jgi:NADP-dependent 3-hydroxy acid dehydrogenase YdfG
LFFHLIEVSKKAMNIVITGVSKGLGRAMVDQFIEMGHTVAGCARNESAVTDLMQRYGKPHRFDSVDVTSAEAVENWAVLGSG